MTKIITSAAKGGERLYEALYWLVVIAVLSVLVAKSFAK
jgi:hypothetical protein